ncbi:MULTISPECIES: hypothetical protein [Bacillaceae]|nr:hypothetical protein [Bacillus sp. S3]QCJ40664.1 bacitracin ABC transporter ATP-binding protein [Bacillus sp. S3]
MSTHKKPLFTDEFLEELAKEISLLYGGPDYKTDHLKEKSEGGKQNSEE